MAHIRGIVVNLTTGTGGYAGTDDHIYVGIFGKDGGREFPLDVEGFDDFEAGTSVTYWLGTVWEGTALSGARKPYESESLGWNDPYRHHFDLDDVDYVYLRKGGATSGRSDDYYGLDQVEVILYGASPNKRTFSYPWGNNIRLGNEYGRQVFIPED